MRAAALALVLMLLAGCLGSVPREARIVLVTERIEAAATVPGDLGPHCEAYRWDEDEPSAHLEPYDGPRPRFVVLRVVPEREGVASPGMGRLAHASPDGEGSMELASLVQGGPVLATLAWTRDGATLDGASLAEPVTVTRAFAVGPPGEEVHVNESLVARDLGVGKVTWDRPGPFAACR